MEACRVWGLGNYGIETSPSVPSGQQPCSVLRLSVVLRGIFLIVVCFKNCEGALSHFQLGLFHEKQEVVSHFVETGGLGTFDCDAMRLPLQSLENVLNLIKVKSGLEVISGLVHLSVEMLKSLQDFQLKSDWFKQGLA